MKQIEMLPGSLQLPCPSPATSKPAAKAQTRAELLHPVLPCILQMPEPGWGRHTCPSVQLLCYGGHPRTLSQASSRFMGPQISKPA